MNEVRDYNEVMTVMHETNDIETLRSSINYLVKNKYKYPLIQLWFAREIYDERIYKLLNIKFNSN